MSNPQEEITGKRPKNYSLWHRYPTLPKWCYQTDGDFFEQRVKDGVLQSVAYIETIEVPSVDNADKRYPPWKSKVNLCLEIEKKMGIPAYIVWHNADCNDFLVMRITETTSQRMDEEEYIGFVKNL